MFQDIEESFKVGSKDVQKGINLYALDINNLPILNATINLANSLLYKQEYNKEYLQCWLLYNNEHFDVITNIEAFLCVRHFCYKCLKTFLHKDDFENHTCNACADIEEEDKTPIHKIHFLKDSQHYLKKGRCLGSTDEMIFEIGYDVFNEYSDNLKKNSGNKYLKKDKYQNILHNMKIQILEEKLFGWSTRERSESNFSIIFCTKIFCLNFLRPKFDLYQTFLIL